MNVENDDLMRRRAFLTLLASLVVAVVLSVVVILPAEVGWDPLGTGEAIGVMGLSGGEEMDDVVVASGDIRGDERRFVLDPFASIEIKYDMVKNAAVVFQWSSEGEVLYDLHGEPTIGGEEASVSFAQARAPNAAGTFVAPFDGIHGWFFENRGHTTVEVAFQIHGFVDGVTYYEGNDKRRLELTD